GIGVGRCRAAIAERCGDPTGLAWPLPVAPFEVVLTLVNPKDAVASDAAGALYDALVREGVEVLFDDRDERPGVKFNDADLIGVPYGLTVGPHARAEGRGELVRRSARETRTLDRQKAAREVTERVLEERGRNS